MFQPNYQKICSKVLNNLPERQKEIIARRFGLESCKRETLQKIGEDFNVTRERIRQIESEGFTKLEPYKEAPELRKVFLGLENYLCNAGGLKREDMFLQSLGGERFQNHVAFLLTLGEAFHRFSEDSELYSFWATGKALFQEVREVIAKVLEKFETEQRPIPEKSLLELSRKEQLPLFFSSIEISKKIEKGPLGEFGLVDWPEIKPRGVRDGAFLALKKTGKPLHFREIARVSATLPGEFFQKRNILSQTVHNELIRDERFVLIGRGTYALKEWGYLSGTVKDIIIKILKESGGPMAREEILQAVHKQRIIKDNTVLLSLADRDYFSRNEEGEYTLLNLGRNAKVE